ncbi:MAG: hypothetical protein M3388_15005 [Acidobacteriota bacterium]|nr:hypothetical protein [Acidobacteriota bacterium]
MGILDKIFGGDDEPQMQKSGTQRNPNDKSAAGAQTEDEAAIARYRYMLKTAPPETIEQAHAEAFAKLTPQQRQMVLQQLNENLPEDERRALAQSGDDSQALARAATRAEMRQPGTMERAFGGAGGAMPGFGGMLAGSLLGSIAGTVIGSYVAQQFFADDAGGFDSAGDSGNEAETSSNEADYGQDETADAGSDFGDFGGDF